MRKIKRLFNLIIDAFFPKNVTCMACDAELKNEEERKDTLCSRCHKELTYIGDKVQIIENEDLCIDDFASVYAYEGIARTLVIAFKDGNKSYMGEFIAERLYRLIQKRKILVDGICFVPSSKVKVRKREYDHMEIVAKNLSLYSGLEIIKVLGRHNIGVDQTQSKDRYKNIEGQYYYIEKQDIRNKDLILIDDVVTTGATISKCGELLKKHGARRIYLLTFTEAKSFDSYKSKQIKRMATRTK